MGFEAIGISRHPLQLTVTKVAVSLAEKIKTNVANERLSLGRSQMENSVKITQSVSRCTNAAGP